MEQRRDEEIPDPEPHSCLCVREQLILSVLSFGLNFQGAALAPVVIPAQVLLFVAPGSTGNAHQALFVGILMAAGACLALIIQPIVGALSDRAVDVSRRRLPYVIVGVVVLLSGLLTLAFAGGLVLFVIGFLLAQVGVNICTAGYQGLLPDHVPVEQRGSASGFMGLMTMLGTVGSLATAAFLLRNGGTGPALAKSIQHGVLTYYVLAGCIVILAAAITAKWVPNIPRASVPSAPYRIHRRARRRAYIRAFLEPWRHHNFAWVFLTRGFVALGFTLFLTFIEYYFARVAHVAHFIQATAVLAVLALVGALVSTLVMGILSDHIRRVLVVCIATFFMAIPALAFVVAPGQVPLWPLGLFFGIGYGAYTSVDWALAIDALPSAATSAGKDLGLWNMASTLPALGAPLLGSLVIALASAAGQTAIGYRAVFGVAVLFFVFGAVFVLKVREHATVR